MEPTPYVMSVPARDAEAGLVLAALTRLRRGDATVRLPQEWRGLWGQLADTFNSLITDLVHPTSANLAKFSRLLAQSQSLAQELQDTNEALEEKARQVALTSKYKSEFLANMSHELRTPLNSLLILSEQLARNSEGNLSARQVEFARTIQSSGNDLLMLINDILDLSKIESGTVMVDVSELRLSDLQRHVERTFRHVAEARGVEFVVDTRLRPSVALRTDIKRLHQILKNLLSNAFKFTQQGSVRLVIDEAREGWTAGHTGLQQARRVIAFTVIDTGIGISPDKQQIIFDAFQQADGSTSRKYGGTGLGLAISRELSRLLGGEIRLSSSPGRGSTFTLYLPLRYPSARGERRLAPEGDALASQPARQRRPAAPARPLGDEVPALEVPRPPVADDRERIRPGDAVLLIVHSDVEAAARLLEAGRLRGFKGVVCCSGADALVQARRCQPEALMLGADLSDMAGRRLLERLRHDLALRHLPVCWISDAAEVTLDGLRAYAARRQRRILVALKDVAVRRELQSLLEDDLIQPVVVRSAPRLLVLLERDTFDAVLIDAAFVRGDGERLRAALAVAPAVHQHLLPVPPPIVLYSRPGAAGAGAGAACRWWPDGVAVREAGTLPELFDLALQSLHHPVQRLPEERRALLQTLLEARRPLAGQRVLIVDDDMRNIFALATVLEEQGMDVVWADNGREAIERVASDPQVAVVLMDIMMPELDGLATLREIRRLPRGRELPMIAVTAKAMKGDREKCIEAGAWDYLSKPVNPHELLTALRAWLQA